MLPLENDTISNRKEWHLPRKRNNSSPIKAPNWGLPFQA